MIITYYPSFKKTQNLKDMKFKKFQISKYFSKFSNFKIKCRIWKFSYLFNNDYYKTCDILGKLYVFLITSCKIFH